MHTSQIEQPACNGQCEACAVAEQADLASRQPGAMRGGAFAGAAMGYFGGPLLLTVGGAALAGPGAAGQLLGGAGGLVIGMIIAGLVARRVGRSAQSATPGASEVVSS
jgi:hypothetical protein